MGTIGGKIGLVAGIIAGFLAIGPMMDLALGDCFFEEGCGNSETIGLFAVGLGCLVVAVAVGLIVRFAANMLSKASR